MNLIAYRPDMEINICPRWVLAKSSLPVEVHRHLGMLVLECSRPRTASISTCCSPFLPVSAPAWSSLSRMRRPSRNGGFAETGYCVGVSLKPGFPRVVCVTGISNNR